MLILGKIARSIQILGLNENPLIIAQTLRIIAELIDKEKGFPIPLIPAAIACVRNQQVRPTTTLLRALLHRVHKETLP